MVNKFKPGSFTKNFAWDSDLSKLQVAIFNGFSGHLDPISRSKWRENSSINDTALQLIPLNFFLHSSKKSDSDYVLADEFVSYSIKHSYDEIFDRLALFSFHLANSGSWRGSCSHDGRIALWANYFIRKIAWRDGCWHRKHFSDSNLSNFFDAHLDAKPKSKRKMQTNYRYMLRLAGVLGSGTWDKIDLHPEEWGESACRIFWDRMLYGGNTDSLPSQEFMMKSFIDQEIYKLLGCSVEVGFKIAANSIDRYIEEGAIWRFPSQ